MWWASPGPSRPQIRSQRRDRGAVRRPHEDQVSPEDVNLGSSRILGVRAPMGRLSRKPDAEISFSAPWRSTEQERKAVCGNVALNSKGLRLFLEQRV